VRFTFPLAGNLSASAPYDLHELLRTSLENGQRDVALCTPLALGGSALATTALLATLALFPSCHVITYLSLGLLLDGG